MKTAGCGYAKRSWLIVFLVMSLGGSAQMTLGLNKDSLRSLISTMKDDTAKADTYILLGQQYENNTPDSAIYFYQQANRLSTSLNYAAGIIRYINNYTAVLNVQGKYDESLALHDQALELEDKFHLKYERAKTLFNIGVVYQYKGDYKAAMDHFLSNLPAFEEEENGIGLQIVYANIAGIYRSLNQKDKALEFAEKSLALALKHPDDLTEIGHSYLNMANALKDAGRIKEQETFLYKAYDLSKQIPDINLQETALINLGDFLTDKVSPDTYLPLFRKALILADSLDDVYGKSLILQGIGYGLFRKGNYREAEQQAMEALRFSREYEQHESEAKTLLLLSDIRIGLGDLAASSRYRGEYDSVYSAIVSKDLLKNLQQLETSYELQKKKAELLKQQLQLEQKDRQTSRQRTWLWLLIAGVIVMGLLIFWGRRYYRQRQQLDKKNLEALKSGQENLRLKSLMEGQLLERQRISQEMHDDMGTGLTSILFLSRTIQGQESVSARLKQTAQDLIQKMNEIIWVMNHQQDTLDSLVAYMRMHIAEALDNAGIGYSFTVTEPLPLIKLNQEYRRNVYLCCKEAVHNCIKHSGADEVKISVEAGSRLEICIQDNGHGLPAGRKAGNGLSNMERRMEQTGGTFTLRSGEKGTTILLTAPLPV